MIRPRHFLAAAAVAAPLVAAPFSLASSQADGESCRFVGLLEQRVEEPDNPFAPPAPLDDSFSVTVVAECEFRTAVANSDGSTSTVERKEMRFTTLDVEALTMIVDSFEGRALPENVDLSDDDTAP